MSDRWPFEPERYELHVAMTRREVLGITGAGLLFILTTPADAQGVAAESRIHAGDDGVFTIFTGKIEEGQGARTEIAMAAAEELGVALEKVRVVTADTDLTPNDGITAGSRTTPATVPAVRRAAAAVRKAAGLRSPGSWTVLGKAQSPLQARAMVTGEHRYPSDITRPGMLYGAVLRPPSYGATLETLEAGDVKYIRDGDFIGCVADNSYAARNAVKELGNGAKWKTKPAVNNAGLNEHLRKTAQAGRPQVAGNPVQALVGAAKKLQATYTAAYVAHTPMEPRASVAEWSADGRLTVWTGTSNPFSVRDELVRAFGLSAAKVRVIVPDTGGGFGGKHTGEAAVEAARLARAAGKPVKLRWSRSEEFTWAYARPAAVIDVEAGLDEKGSIAAWLFTNINSGTAALQSPYRLAHARHVFRPADSPLRQGSYRALASTANNFARESFMDELAAAAGADPLEFRLAHLDNERIRAVLIAAAEKFRWKDRRAAKRPVGLACGTEKNSVVAACVEATVDPKTGEARVVEVCQAFECGAVLNPLGLRSQVEGCILMGLGAALREEILFDQGRVINARMGAYRPPRFADVPKMDLIFLDRKDQEAVGAGETPIIAVAPALANAIFAATGERRRSLPLRRAGAKT